MSIYDFLLRILLEGRMNQLLTSPLVLGLSTFYLLAALIGRWMVLKKAGKPAWHSIIPVLSRYDLYDISWIGWIGFVVIGFQILNILVSPANSSLRPGFAALIYFGSFAVYFGLGMVMKLKLARSFGKGIAFSFGLFFMEDLMFLILAFDKSRYYGRTLQKFNPPAPEIVIPKKHKRRHYVVNLTKQHSQIAFVASVTVTFCTFFAVAGGLMTAPSEITPERGQNLFRLFTVNSNTLSAFGAAFLIPYAVEGIRNKRFDFPKWVAMFQYSGAICTSLTMLFASTFIAGTMGPKLAFTGMNFWLHVVCPIMSLVLFFSTESRIHFSVEDSFKALIPFYAYAIVYIVNVVLIGEDMGGWRDIYRLTKYIPAEFSGPMMFMLGFGIASLMRVIYNRMNEKRRERMAAIWKTGEMDLIEANIEVYGIGRYIGLKSRDSITTLPMDVFDDITESIDTTTDHLIQICARGISEGRKESLENYKKINKWYDLLIGTPEYKAVTVTEE